MTWHTTKTARHTVTKLESSPVSTVTITPVNTKGHIMHSSYERKKEALVKALDGTLAPHYLVQLQMLLQDFHYVQAQLSTLEMMITEITKAHYSLAYECLDSITGIARRSAQIILR